MARHSNRDPRSGRWATTPSGAPIPAGDDHTGADPLAYDGPVQDANAETYPEFANPYPAHHAGDLSYDPSHGGYQRAIPHRRQVVVDAQTGQELSDHITDVRAVDRLLGSQQRQAAHLQAAEGDPFVSALMSRPSYDFHRQGHEHMMDTPGVDNNDTSHHAWPGEVGQQMRERP
jgi:hypothetical protein